MQNRIQAPTSLHAPEKLQHVMFTLFSTGKKDAVQIYGKPKDLRLNFFYTDFKGNESLKYKLHLHSDMEYFIDSPVLNELHICADFTVSYQTSPTINIIYSGNDHRSWIDIIMIYNEIYKDMSLFDSKYLIQTISESQIKAHSQHAAINTMPDVTDQMLVFNMGDSPTSNRQNRSFKMIKEILDNKCTYKDLNLMLRWDVVLQAIPNSWNSVSLQGHSQQIKIYSQCATTKTCLNLNVYWIPNQLSNYREDSHNNPHNCVKQKQINMPSRILCLNFSSNSIEQLYYIYIAELSSHIQDMFSTSHKNEIEMSWNDASSLCQNMGGYLPIIRSKSELDIFIALVTFSKYIPPQNKVFIGLSANISKVRIHFLYWTNDT